MAQVLVICISHIQSFLSQVFPFVGCVTACHGLKTFIPSPIGEAEADIHKYPVSCSTFCLGFQHMIRFFPCLWWSPMEIVIHVFSADIGVFLLKDEQFFYKSCWVCCGFSSASNSCLLLSSFPDVPSNSWPFSCWRWVRSGPKFFWRWRRDTVRLSDKVLHSSTSTVAFHGFYSSILPCTVKKSTAGRNNKIS